jgi:release factor glutamine methyltransferase
MRRRRHAAPDDSLELLLDPICNMFGTIMFVALISALLVLSRSGDVVAEAVELARENARRLGASLDLRTGDLWSAAHPGERFDLVVSNPPYVTDAEYAELDRNVKEYEPASALKGGRDGLDLVRRVVEGAAARLEAGGLLLVEIGWKHGDAARALVAGPRWSGVEILKDGEGIDRVLCAQRTAAA